MKYKKGKVLIGALSLLILWFGLSFAGDTETCGYCNTNADCQNGWCGPFTDGKSHCVPMSVSPYGSYSCSTYEVSRAGAYGKGGHGG